MLQQLQWIEIILKAAPGLTLLAAPRTAALLLGLPAADEPFWPRLCGALLAGLAIATAIESRWLPGTSIGLAGHAAINLAVAAVLGGLLILGRAGTTKRGRLLLAIAAAVLGLLELVEIVSLG